MPRTGRTPSWWGSTGSGKSELLLSWLLALAVRHSPDALQLVLVDYKGGATFRALAGLPHTAGVLTDLEPDLTERALTSLGAEVRRRKSALARAGAADLSAYRRSPGAGRMPRLLVVVDEYRSLADSHPRVLEGLVGLAAQGRSLGIHLLLATQRTGGAVGADVRANLAVRVCLRVHEAADSVEVVGTPAAARLPPQPGGAVLRTDRLRSVQVLWAGPPEDGLVEEVVAAARATWRRRAGGRPPARPWAPPLPPALTRHELPDEPHDADRGPAGAPGRAPLPVARTDMPAAQRLGTWSWSGPALLVTGGPATGRTETLRTVLASALAAGVPAHVVAPDVGAFGDAAGAALGTVAPATDPRLVRRLLELLAGAPGHDQVLLVDDADLVCEALDGAVPGRGAALLGAAVRATGRTGVRVALAGPPSLVTARWTEGVRTRLVLAPRDETEAALAGVPVALRAHHPRPGRAVLIEPGRALAAQVALAGSPSPASSAPVADVPRLRPLPLRVPLDGSTAGHGVVLGRGGDDASWVAVDCAPGTRLLVAGPPGSGRSTALATLRTQLRARGRPLSDGVPPAGWRPGPGAVVVVDDADACPPQDLERLESLTGVAVLAAARSDAVAAAYRGPLVTWRSTAVLVLLRPTHPATAHLSDVDIGGAVDPARPHHPGRGVVVQRGRATPVQVAVAEPR